MKTKEDNSANSTLLRGLMIMQKVAESSRSISATDLVEELNLPKPTVHRIAMKLEEAGYLQREPGNKRFIIGTQLKDFSFKVQTNFAINAPRHAILQKLSDEIGETCNCTMLQGNHIVYFDRVETNWPYRIQLPVGSKLPMHCTASGKLFLAHMLGSKRKHLINAATLEKHTERTITDPEKLEKALKQIANDGIGVDNEELMQGMVALAVPVFNNKGDVVFTIAVHAPCIRKSLDDLRQYIPSLKQAAVAMMEYCDLAQSTE